MQHPFIEFCCLLQLPCNSPCAVLSTVCFQRDECILFPSFSSCCRSVAINLCITALRVGPHTAPEAASSALAAFPKHAQLRMLAIDDNDLPRMFSHLLGPGAAACARLQLVDCIQFRVSISLHACPSMRDVFAFIYACMPISEGRALFFVLALAPASSFITYKRLSSFITYKL